MKIVAMLAIVGVASLVSAARVVTVGFDADRDTAALGETITWTVSVSWVEDEFPDDAYVGGFVGDFIASDHGLGQVSGFESLMLHEATTPTGAGASALGVNVFQAFLLDGYNIDLSNPIGIYRFDALASAEGVLRYEAAGELFLTDFAIIHPGLYNVVSVSDEVAIVPGVGVAWVLGLGAAMAGRRRR